MGNCTSTFPSIPQETCSTCNVYFWLLVFASCYGVLVNLMLVYGLKKTTAKFKSWQLLQFLLGLVDITAILIYFVKTDGKVPKVVTAIVTSLSNILFLMEVFILALMVFCRFITISYPFQNNLISKYINKKMFTVTLCLVNLLVFTFLEAVIKIMGNTAIHMVYYITVIWLCFILMIIFNILSIKKLRKSSGPNSPSVRSTENNKKAVTTITMMTILTIMFSLPDNIFQIVELWRLFKGCQRATLSHYSKFVLAIYFFGMGVNSNVLLCRSSEIMNLMKKKLKIGKRTTA